MTTRLEIEYIVVNRGKITKSRKTLLELEDRRGVHRTEFGDVEIDVKRVGHFLSAYYYHVASHNVDIIIDARNAPDLAERLKAPKRRISVGKDGRGAQQIGKEITLFVATDLTKRSV